MFEDINKLKYFKKSGGCGPGSWIWRISDRRPHQVCNHRAEERENLFSSDPEERKCKEV